MAFQVKGTEHFYALVQIGPLFRIQQTRDLHADSRCAGSPLQMKDIVYKSPSHCKGINAEVPIDMFVFCKQNRLLQLWRQLGQPCPKAPLLVLREKGMQDSTVLRADEGCVFDVGVYG